MRILIIDDEKFNLTIAEAIIGDSDITAEIILCQSPIQALDILDPDIDIVLLDIIMPEMNGIELLSELRKREELNDVQVLMLTSLSEKKYIKMSFESGADDYIAKPIETVEFVARLKGAIKKRQNSLTLRQINDKITLQNKELKEMALKLKETKMHMIQKGTLASLGELAAGIAHEINNPIGFVGSNLETMKNFSEKIKKALEAYRVLIEMLDKDENLSIQSKTQMEEIKKLERDLKLDFVLEELMNITTDSREGIDRVARIVKTLRTYARSGYDETLFPNDLNKIIDETLIMVHNEAKYKIDIVIEYGDIPQVICNRLQVGQVILNVLINAIQAIKSQNRSERGRIVIQTYSEGNYVCCRISDDGPGIKKEYLERVFDPFFTTKEAGEGTGLGLSISYDIIVTKHNGEFFVSSEENKGAILTFKIPMSSD